MDETDDDFSVTDGGSDLGANDEMDDDLESFPHEPAMVEATSITDVLLAQPDLAGLLLLLTLDVKDVRLDGREHPKRTTSSQISDS